MGVPDIWSIAKKVVERESQAVNGSLQRLNKDDFCNAVKAILSAPLIVATACGASSLAAMKFVHLLCCIGRPSVFLSPTEAVHGGMGCVHNQDVVVIISKGGMSQELIPILSIAKKLGAIIIVLTENVDSSLAHDADILLLAQSVEETDKNQVLATSSFVAEVAILDAIICATIESGGFDLKEFSIIHPNGAVGLKLNPQN